MGYRLVSVALLNLVLVGLVMPRAMDSVNVLSRIRRDGFGNHWCPEGKILVKRDKGYDCVVDDSESSESSESSKSGHAGGFGGLGGLGSGGGGFGAGGR